MEAHQLTKAELRSGKESRTQFFQKTRTPITLVLDSFKVAFNIGVVLRLADALLLEKVYICGNTLIPPNRKIKTTSRGAERWVPWEYREDIVVSNMNDIRNKNQRAAGSRAGTRGKIPPLSP